MQQIPLLAFWNSVSNDLIVPLAKTLSALPGEDLRDLQRLLSPPQVPIKAKPQPWFGENSGKPARSMNLPGFARNRITFSGQP
jgi:hypothetical protein